MYSPHTPYPIPHTRLLPGFSLMEIILCVAIIAIIAGMSMPILQSFQNRNNLQLSTLSVVSAARRAHTLAQSMQGDSSWGIKVQSGGVTLFKCPPATCSSYATRDSTVDETTEIPVSFTISGTTEFIFTKFTGDPVTAGSVTLTSPNNETRTVSINSKSTINY